MLEAARWAPSANNLQPWRYRVLLHGQPDFEAVAARGLTGFNQAWAPNASALVVLSVKTQKDDGSPLDLATVHFDAGLSAAQLVLQAGSLGLHAHYMAGIVRGEITDALQIDDTEHVVVVIAVGQQAEESVLPNEAQRERELAARSRLALSEVAPKF